MSLGETEGVKQSEEAATADGLPASPTLVKMKLVTKSAVKGGNTKFAVKPFLVPADSRLCQSLIRRETESQVGVCFCIL